MKIQSKSQFLNFFGIISLFNKNKLSKSQKMKESEYPTFTKAPVVQIVDNIETLKELFQAISERNKESLRARATEYKITYDKENTNWLELYVDIERYERLLKIQSEIQSEIRAKADKYNISYKKENIDWGKLTDEIEKWEWLLEQANEYNLKVDPNNYDPIGVEQQIEEELYKGRQEMKDLQAEYYATRLSY
jgi:hypothetical protein